MQSRKWGEHLAWGTRPQLSRPIFWLALSLMPLCAQASARRVVPPDAHKLLGESSIACKVRVTSVTTSGTAPGTELGMASPAAFERAVAVCDVLTVLKGACPATIRIEHPGHRGAYRYDADPAPVSLSVGDVRLVFLDRNGGRLIFHDLDHPDLPATTDAPAFGKDASPDDRLLGELVVNARSGDPVLMDLGFIQLAAWCHSQAETYQPPPASAIVFHPEMQALLSESLASMETARRGLAAWVSIQAGISPGARRYSPLASMWPGVPSGVSTVAARAEPVLPGAYRFPTANWIYAGDTPTASVLLRVQSGLATGAEKAASDLASADMLPTAFSYFSTGGISPWVQRRLVDALEASTQHLHPPSNREPGQAARGIDGFDYASFCHLALGMPAALSDSDIRRSIAGIIRNMADERSIPDAITLLDDADPYVRSCAAAALQKIVHHEEPAGSPAASLPVGR